MTKSKFFSRRIPPELFIHIEKYREKTDETKTDVLVRALCAYTGYSFSTAEIKENPLHTKLRSLTKTVLKRGNNGLKIDIN